MAAPAHSTTTSRRLFLAAGSAATVFAAVGAAAAAEALPADADARLFELVAEGKRWWKEICDICDLPEDDDPEYEKRLARAHSQYSAAFNEAISTVPQTVAGMRALLVWVKDDCCEDISLPDENVAALVESVLASPVLAI